ncbi:uncharacterized protein LOC144071202 isoform X2 [Stigmatopora argus]
MDFSFAADLSGSDNDPLDRAFLLDKMPIVIPETPSPQLAKRPRRRRPEDEAPSPTRTRRVAAAAAAEAEERAPKRRKKAVPTVAARRPSSDTSSSSWSSFFSPSSSSRTTSDYDDEEEGGAGPSDSLSFLTAEERMWLSGEGDDASPVGGTRYEQDGNLSVRVVQMEEDEAFARSLQAQFDQEEEESHHGHHHHRLHLSTGRRRGRRNATPSQDYSGNDYEALLALEERQGAVVSQRLTRARIQRFPLKCFDGGGGNTRCQICFCDYERGEQLRMLPCFHDYHAQCVDRWLQENPTCPVCRVNLADL